MKGAGFKMVKKIIFMIVVGIVMNSNAHKQEMHQYITKEAYKLLLYSFPNNLLEMGSFLGSDENCFSGNWPDRSWGAGLIVSGAWDEDESDPVFHYGMLQAPTYDQTFSLPSAIGPQEAYTSITHFWNPDGGKNSTVALNDHTLGVPWSFTIDENAYLKIKVYANGGYIFRSWYAESRDQPKAFQNYCGDDIGMAYQDFTMLSIFDLYENKAYYPFDYLNLAATKWYSATCSTPITGQKYQAYEILGRMAHLLQDMTVPEHVHNDSHGCSHGMRCSMYEDNELSFTPHCTAEELWNEGFKYINPYFNSKENDPLYHLMYCLAQITDHYGSAGKDGDNDYDHQFYLITKNIRKLGAAQNSNDVTVESCEEMHDVLIPLAIRFTAGLMYWFGVETGMLPKISSNDNSAEIEPIVNLLLLD